MHLAPKCTGLTQDIIICKRYFLNNYLLKCQSCVDRKEKDALLEHISSFRENIEVKGLKQEVGETRAEIRDKNVSLIIQIPEMKKKTNEKLATRAHPSEPKPTNNQRLQT